MRGMVSITSAISALSRNVRRETVVQRPLTFLAMEYTPPAILFNAHLETIYPALFRSVNFAPSKIQHIPTPDDDFLEISLHQQKSEKLVIILHGLEGNLHRPYIRGMARACHTAGFDVLTWNFRGCGATMNKQLRFYHSGATDDLDTVINFVLHSFHYHEIDVIGFSLGGNITLKYFGEKRDRHDAIKKAVAISVPMDLKTSCEKISLPVNRLYSNRFLKSLKSKVISKSRLRPGINLAGLDRITTLKDFDDRYTAPLHGFNDALEYYRRCSSINFVHDITIPTLILNAKNDPFLSAECYPVDTLRDHPYVRFESPERGGHVGFVRFGNDGLYWSEARTIEFLRA